jgi:twitching motility protein PilT
MIEEILLKISDVKEVSNIIISPGLNPRIRVNSALVNTDFPVVTESEILSFLKDISNIKGQSDYFEIFKIKKSVEFSVSFGKSRFRCIVFYQNGSVALIARKINFHVPDFESLGYSHGFGSLVDAKSGLILIGGPTNSGKTTTLAACVDYFNSKYHYHIVTIEDPIEYIFSNNKSIISQREVPRDVISFEEGLKDALRQNPDIIVIGEIRTPEVLETAIRAAETGHLVISTVHASSLSDMVLRLVSLAPPARVDHIRSELASVVHLLVWQRLITINDGAQQRLHLVYEALSKTPAVASMIKNSKENQFVNELFKQKRKTFSEQIRQLFAEGKISEETATQYIAEITNSL